MAPSVAAGNVDVMSRLQSVCGTSGPASVAARLADLVDLVQWDLEKVEAGIDSFPNPERLVEKASVHILDLGGKRLRPTCVVLAARMGNGFSQTVQDFATSVELVHCATLLHDDVVDLGETRRGAEAARMIYGNAASVFAGDWLLVEALQRVLRTGVGEAMKRLLEILDEMILAESLQLEARGDFTPNRQRYFSIVEGKTAALFRWAMFAGALGGGCSNEDANALETYGLHLGIAFQLIDDLLDFVGNAEETGKALFTDLREGKMTYPLIAAAEKDNSIVEDLRQIIENGNAADSQQLLTKLNEIGVFEETKALANEHADFAINALSSFGDSRAKNALRTVAEATVSRDK